jgi:hypothetical protein
LVSNTSERRFDRHSTQTDGSILGQVIDLEELLKIIWMLAENEWEH